MICVKKVVLNVGVLPGDGEFLTCKWFSEFLNRKNKKHYVYTLEKKELIDTCIDKDTIAEDVYVYRRVEKPELLDEPHYIGVRYFISKDLGLELGYTEFSNIIGTYLKYELSNDLEGLKTLDFEIYTQTKLLNNREDQDLIDIVNEINDESLIKIIEIPDNIDYKVCSSDFSEKEWIEEKGKVWR